MPVFAQSDANPTVVNTEKSSAESRSKIDEKHALFAPLQAGYKATDLIKEIRDYECQFYKRELIGNKPLESSMKLKFREEPFSVYLKFVDKSNKDREVLFVKGQNNNNLLVREGGIKALLGVIPLAPDGRDAMAENKYPVTTIGIKQMLDPVIIQWESETKLNTTTVKTLTEQKLPEKLSSSETCTVYETINPQANKDLRFHKTRLWIDDKSGLAIGVQKWVFPAKAGGEPPLAEEYFYCRLKPNVKLKDADFDKNNPSYSFR